MHLTVLLAALLATMLTLTGIAQPVFPQLPRVRRLI
jgi:hypothetical protein